MAPSQLPTRGVFARPVDAPLATPDNQLLQVADALKDFNPALQKFASGYSGDFAADQETAGSEAALTSALSYRDAVKQGKLAVGDNPWFRRAYKEQLGRNTGLGLQGDLNAAYEQWDGKDSDDPNAFKGFVGDFLHNATQDVSDPDVMRGLQPQVRQAVQDLTVAHSSYTTKRIEQGYTDATSSAITNLVRTNPTPDAFGQEIEDMKGEAKLTGFPLAQWDKAVTEGVRAAAYEKLDPDILKLLDVHRADGTPPISTKSEVALQLAKDRDEINQHAYWAAHDESRAETAADKQKVQDWGNRAFTEAVNAPDGTLSRETIIGMQKDIGLTASKTILNDLTAIAPVMAGVKDTWHSQDDLDEANTAAFTKGDVQHIQDMITQGRIPGQQRAEYLRGANAYNNAKATQARTNTNFDWSQHERDEKQQKEDAAKAAKAAEQQRAQLYRQSQPYLPKNSKQRASDTQQLNAAIAKFGEKSARDAYDAAHGGVRGISTLIIASAPVSATAVSTDEPDVPAY